MTATALNLTAAGVTAMARPHRERFNTAMDLVVKKYNHHHEMLGRHSEDDDHRLRWLWAKVNEVGGDVNDVGLPDIEALVLANFRTDLASVAGMALAWLAHLGVRGGENKVWQERERQRQLFREQKISFDVASSIIDPRRKFRVLAEEVGEVAHAIDQNENHGMAAGNLHLELIQVAAVTVAWLESLEANS